MEVRSGGLKRYIKTHGVYVLQSNKGRSKTDWIVKVGVVVVLPF